MYKDHLSVPSLQIREDQQFLILFKTFILLINNMYIAISRIQMLSYQITENVKQLKGFSILKINSMFFCVCGTEQVGHHVTVKFTTTVSVSASTDCTVGNFISP